jgi:hypothetical protein
MKTQLFPRKVTNKEMLKVILPLGLFVLSLFVAFTLALQ